MCVNMDNGFVNGIIIDLKNVFDMVEYIILIYKFKVLGVFEVCFVWF